MKYTESKKHLDPEELPLCSRLAWCGGRRLAPSPIASPVPNLGGILSCKNTSQWMYKFDVFPKNLRYIYSRYISQSKITRN